MACCAFLAFIIGQCLALAEAWRRRIAAVLCLGRAPRASAAAGARRLPWSKGLLAALVIELGFASGCAGGAWLVHGSAAPAATLAAFCGIGKTASAR